MRPFVTKATTSPNKHLIISKNFYLPGNLYLLFDILECSIPPLSFRHVCCQAAQDFLILSYCNIHLIMMAICSYHWYHLLGIACARYWVGRCFSRTPSVSWDSPHPHNAGVQTQAWRGSGHELGSGCLFQQRGHQDSLRGAQDTVTKERLGCKGGGLLPMSWEQKACAIISHPRWQGDAPFGVDLEEEARADSSTFCPWECSLQSTLNIRPPRDFIWSR